MKGVRFFVLLFLCLFLTACPFSVPFYPLEVSVRVDEATSEVCNAGIQATFMVDGQSIASPRLQSEQHWQQQVGAFSPFEVITVTVEAYCYRQEQEAGYVKAEIQMLAPRPKGSLSVFAPPQDWCDVTKYGWTEAIDPVPCIRASNSTIPTPMVLVVDAENIDMDVCDIGLQATVFVGEDSLTSPLLTIGERWVESFGRFEPADAYPLIVEAYCYREEQQAGYTKFSNTYILQVLNPLVVYISEPISESSAANRNCILDTNESVNPAPCVGLVSSTRPFRKAE